jgi:23S rRNA 5-hydroxycytidine C2501 synthase
VHHYTLKLTPLKRIELLAPARNLETGIAAINFGADAVYIGYNSFGARDAAGNSIDDIEKLVEHAHFFYAKVFVTINTIIYSNELNEVKNLIHQLYSIGVDAIIIQDMGILEMDLPPIPIHASTQTHNNSLEKIKFFESVGLQRVILARELSLEEIGVISNNTTIELEVFVHGALCVSYSGQCYFSHAITGRSANRGECAQPCRSLYNLVDENGRIIANSKHLLSLKDSNQSENIDLLLDAGVTSFKIEGRLKDIDYVKNITAHYRKIIDAAIVRKSNLRKASSGIVIFNFEPNPERSFNRGFTTYFINGRQKAQATLHTQKATGQFVGKVSITSSSWFTIDGNIAIANGDGLCFFNKKGVLTGLRANKVDGSKIFPLAMNGIAIGDKVFRNSDKAFSDLLATNVASRQIRGNIIVAISQNTIRATFIDEDEISTSIDKEYVYEASKNITNITNSLKSQFSKTGGLPFKIQNVEVKIEKNITPFFSLSEVNAWRRELLDSHFKTRILSYPRVDISLSPNNSPYFQNQLTFNANVSNPLAKKFYLRHGAESIDDAFELDNNFWGREIMNTRYCILFELGYCNGKTKSSTLPKKLYLQDQHRKYPLSFNCNHCNMSIYFPNKE